LLIKLGTPLSRILPVAVALRAEREVVQEIPGARRLIVGNGTQILGASTVDVRHCHVDPTKLSYER
jgi:hypothetical protein